MELNGEVFNMGLSLRLPKVTPDPLLDYIDFKNTQLISPAFNTDYDTFQSPMYISNDTYNDTSEEYEMFYRHSFTMTMLYCVAYFLVFIVGLVGNSFVIAVVFRAPRMRTVTNYFIVNLALADILVIVFCLPATLMSNIFVPWVLGWLMCKTVPYIQGVSVAASVYSLIAVSVDRFLAIWWPLKLQITKRRARFIIFGIWVIALTSTIPWALFFELVSVPELPPDIKVCLEIWPPALNGSLYFLLANLVACYLLPMALISICYILIWIKVWTRSIPGDSKDAQMDRMQQKSKIKVIKMLVIVIILFVLSWLPLYAIFARIKLGGPLTEKEEELIGMATPIAQWLGSSNSCINPILYAFFNKKYRRGFAAIIRSRKCCGRLGYYETVAIASSSTSTRKSSHYHNNQNSVRRPPYSPSLKSEPVSYIYEQSGKRHTAIAKQDSNLSRQMLIKQDSSISRQDSQLSRQVFKKNYSSDSQFSRQDSNNSCQMLIKQDSNGSRSILSNQDSFISYIEPRKLDELQSTNKSDADSYCSSNLSSSHLNNIINSKQESYPNVRRGILCKQDTQISYVESSNSNSKSSLNNQDISYVENKRHQLIKQDSVISFADERPRRHQLVKQDSIISFADQPRSYLHKQDSTLSGSHTSILKKADSRASSSSPVRKTIGFFHE